MALFGFGGSSSRSSSQSTAYGHSLQGSLDQSSSLSRGTSRSGGQSSQSIAFADLFQSLYGDAMGAAGRAAEMAPAVSSQAQMLFSGGVGFLDMLQGGAGDEYLEGRVSGESPVLAEQIDALGADIGRFLREDVLPGITSEGVATGTLGGGRQGVAQGRAADAATREFQRGATELRGRDVAARDAAAAQLGAGRTAAAAAGLSSLPGLFGVAQGGMGAELMPYEALAAIMGGPTALTESTQFGESDNFSVAQAIARSFGMSEDFAQSTSKSKSMSLSFGPFGGK